MRRYVLRLDHAEPPSNSAPRGGAGQFLQTRQIHRTRYVPAVMLRNVCSFFAVCVRSSTFATSRSSIVPLPSAILHFLSSFLSPRRIHNSLPSSQFEDAMSISDRLVGFSLGEGVELFDKARLVRIAHRGFAIWLNPVGMLSA